MAGISSLGIGSGLDIRGLVDQLVAAERAPTQNRLDRREARLQAELSSFGALKSALNEFRGKVDALADASTFRAIRATSSDTAAITVSASPTAAPQSLDVEVNALAQAQSLASGSFQSPDSPVGAGTLTFRFGTVTADAAGVATGFTVNAERPSASVEIPADAATLADVRDAVNDADIGVRASIINDGNGERLLFSAADTGAANGFVVDVDDADGNDTDAAGLSRLAFNTAASQAALTRAGEDAALVVDGLAVSRPGNVVDDLVPGVTLTLKDTSAGAVRLDLSEDTSGLRNRIQALVDGYNAFQDQVAEIAGFDAASGQGGVLQGNAAVRSLTAALRQQISAPLSALDGGPVRSLADLGITTGFDGRLSVDDATLNEAVTDHFDEVSALFGRAGIAEGSGFRYLGSGSETEAGSYAVNVTQAAQPASVQGSGILAPTLLTPLVIGSGNDTLSLTVDGIDTGTLTLTQGSYTSGASVAAELQARINEVAALQQAGASVTVEFDAAASRFRITSGRDGADSSVAVTAVDTTTAASLGLDASLSDSGVDLAGTLGGVTADVSGQVMTAPSGAAAGLEVEITGAGTGALGSVTVTRGLSDRLLATLDGYLDGDGVLDAATDGINSRIEDIGEDRRRLQERLVRIEQRFIAQFSAMDALVGQLQNTQQFLTGQLANLESLNRQSRNRGRS